MKKSADFFFQEQGSLLGDHLICVGVVCPTVCWVSLVVLLPWVCCSLRACCRLIVGVGVGVVDGVVVGVGVVVVVVPVDGGIGCVSI